MTTFTATHVMTRRNNGNRVFLALGLTPDAAADFEHVHLLDNNGETVATYGYDSKEGGWGAKVNGRTLRNKSEIGVIRDIAAATGFNLPTDRKTAEAATKAAETPKAAKASKASKAAPEGEKVYRRAGDCKGTGYDAPAGTCGTCGRRVLTTENGSAKRHRAA